MYLEWRWGPAGGALSTLVLLVNPRPNRKAGMVYVDSTLLSQKEEDLPPSLARAQPMKDCHNSQ